MATTNNNQLSELNNEELLEAYSSLPRNSRGNKSDPAKAEELIKEMTQRLDALSNQDRFKNEDLDSIVDMYKHIPSKDRTDAIKNVKTRAKSQISDNKTINQEITSPANVNNILMFTKDYNNITTDRLIEMQNAYNGYNNNPNNQFETKLNNLATERLIECMSKETLDANDINTINSLYFNLPPQTRSEDLNTLFAKYTIKEQENIIAMAPRQEEVIAPQQDTATVATSTAPQKEAITVDNSLIEQAIRRIDTLNDGRYDASQIVNDLAKQVGNNLNTAILSCIMAPYALQDTLKLNLEDGQKPTTFNLLNHIAKNGLTEEQIGKFSQFVENNFDGMKINMDNFASYSQQAAITPETIETPEPAPVIKHDIDNIIMSETLHADLKQGMATPITPDKNLEQLILNESLFNQELDTPKEPSKFRSWINKSLDTLGLKSTMQTDAKIADSKMNIIDDLYATASIEDNTTSVAANSEEKTTEQTTITPEMQYILSQNQRS